MKEVKRCWFCGNKVSGEFSFVSTGFVLDPDTKQPIGQMDAEIRYSHRKHMPSLRYALPNVNGEKGG